MLQLEHEAAWRRGHGTGRKEFDSNAVFSMEVCSFPDPLKFLSPPPPLQNEGGATVWGLLYIDSN